MSDCFALLDTPGGGALLFEDLQEFIAIEVPASLASACGRAEEAAAGGCFVVALLDYELGHAIEPATGVATAHAAGDGSGFLVFRRQRSLSAEDLAVFFADRCGAPLPPAALVDFGPTLAAADYAAAVDRIHAYIAAGDCYQINFTFPFGGRCVGDPLTLYAGLRTAQPVACGGFIALPTRCLLSFSPELFIERSAGRIRARPMKGTAARTGEPKDDAQAVAVLRASAKDRAENVMIVDLIRNDLGRIARAGSVQVESLCEVETYPSVLQMTSDVVAESDAPLAAVLAALFPCGSITGAPKVRAMQIIGELERTPRGLYTGAFGWVGKTGDFRLSVAIRTLLVEQQDGVARYGVGSGIVWDSVATAEYGECLLKAAFLRRANAGFRLIETMRLEDACFPLAEMHFDRLAASAKTFSFPLARDAFLHTLDRIAAAEPQGLFRVRLTLGYTGDMDVSAMPLDADEKRTRTRIAEEAVDSSDFWLRHKTTVRVRYDAAMATLTANPELFDLVFLNERGEVCEGARSNVFVRRLPGEPLITPPLCCGVLPGVLRRRLLECGEAVEGVLYAADLRNAAELYLGNALRGLRRVRFSA